MNLRDINHEPRYQSGAEIRQVRILLNIPSDVRVEEPGLSETRVQSPCGPNASPASTLRVGYANHVFEYAAIAWMLWIIWYVSLAFLASRSVYSVSILRRFCQGLDLANLRICGMVKVGSGAYSVDLRICYRDLYTCVHSMHIYIYTHMCVCTCIQYT